MKKFFVITNKAEFFSVVKFIRSKGVRFANEVMGCGVERRSHKYNGMYLTIWYGDPTYRISLDLDDGLNYYYYSDTGVIVVENDIDELVDIIR